MAGLNREYFNCVQLNITNLVNILYTMTQTYRLLVGGAEEFSRIGLAHTHDKDEAIDRADDMGDIIDKVIKKLDHQTSIFLTLFEPEITCALPEKREHKPTPTPTPTPTPLSAQAPEELLEFVVLQDELGKDLEPPQEKVLAQEIESELREDLGSTGKSTES